MNPILEQGKTETLLSYGRTYLIQKYQQKGRTSEILKQ